MNRISPRILGFVVALGGAGVALQFQNPDKQQTASQPAPNSETIEWRSNEFTLELPARDRTLTGSHRVEDRPKSPTFGGGDAVNLHARAALDRSVQPPALADAYKSATVAPLPGPNGLRTHGGLSTTSGEPVGDAFFAATNPLPPVAITHTITDGDTLETLAEKHLGSRLRWTEIYNANPEILDDPEVLPVGVTIVILPGIQPSTASDETESLIPVSRSDLQQFRHAID